GGTGLLDQLAHVVDAEQLLALGRDSDVGAHDSAGDVAGAALDLAADVFQRVVAAGGDPKRDEAPGFDRVEAPAYVPLTGATLADLDEDEPLLLPLLPEVDPLQTAGVDRRRAEGDLLVLV